MSNNHDSLEKSHNVLGKCLCGAVEVKVNTLALKVGACHCNMCRKWSAGPFMAVDGGTEVSFSGEENITRYASSEWAERGFCARCGTNLFYYLKPASQYMFSVEIFDEADNVTFDHQIFIDEKPNYYDFSNKTHNMTGAEVIASFEGN